MNGIGSIYEELDPDEVLLGSTVSRPVEWRQDQVMLYAIGVGAGLGDPSREQAFTTENVAGVRLRVLPTFISILTGPVRPPAFRRLDKRRFIQARQRIELCRPVPTSGRAIADAVVDSVLDKGSGAVASVTTRLYEIAEAAGAAERGPLIGSGTMTVFIKGGGGFGGPRGEADQFALPSRKPDARIIYATRPEQALLYRLSGDHNPLHVDASVARRLGFPRPVLHGLCTYGFAGRALIEAVAGGDPDRVKMMDCRFAKPVYPGDNLTTEIWIEGEAALFHVLNGEGEVVLDRGRATIIR